MARGEMIEEWVRMECEACGFKGKANVAHYMKVLCKCGKWYWALRPQRQGPLRLFPHPGFVVTVKI